MADSNDTALAAQYAAYPYPVRDPADEARRLIIGSPSHLREIDHWGFAARRPASEPLRVLVAGGGTGDATVMIATQLERALRTGHVTHVDRSTAALDIARARITAKGLQSRVTFVEGSLLDPLDQGFDYIDCCGVLHHLPDPAAGLSALTAMLAPGGAMGLMVYAPHGRTGVYMAQDALRHLAPATAPTPARIDTARRLLKHLPEGAWLRQNRSVTDHVAGGDAGLVDLLLNPRDQAFTINRFLALLADAGLAPTCLLEPLRYDPDAYLPDPKLRTAAASLDPVARAALAEAVSGTMSTHVVYCRRATEFLPSADPLAATAVPVVREGTGEALAAAIRPDDTWPFASEALNTSVALPRLSRPILRAIDGTATVAELAQKIGPGFERAWQPLFAKLNAANRLLLAAPP